MKIKMTKTPWLTVTGISLMLVAAVIFVTTTNDCLLVDTSQQPEEVNPQNSQEMGSLAAYVKANRPDGKGICGVKVGLYDKRGQEIVHTITQSRDGYFVMRQIHPGTNDIIFTHPHFFTRKVSDILIQKGGNSLHEVATMISLKGEYVPKQVLVGFKHGTTGEEREKVIATSGSIIIDPPDKLLIALVQIPEGKTVPEMVEYFIRQADVEFAEANAIDHAFGLN